LTTTLALIKESRCVGVLVVVFFTGVNDLDEFCLEIFADTLLRFTVAFFDDVAAAR